MFKELKIVELASVLAGPSVGQFFAELGAQVIKIESKKTGGDVTRTWKGIHEQTDDRSAYFCACNWGKKSIALDIHTLEEKAIVKKLVAQADIVVVSYKPGDAEKLGVSYRQLIEINPRLIYGQVTGYGADSDRVGYDAIVQAESGFMDLNGEQNGGPIKMPVALIDVLAAHQLKEGILLALLKRQQTGEGSLVEVSLIQSALASLCNQATNWLVAKKIPKRQGSTHPNIAPYGDVFTTKDQKKILLAVGSDRQFSDLMRLLDINTLPSTLYETNVKRTQNRDSLNQILATGISNREADELLKKMNEYKIPVGIIQTVPESFEMKAAQELLIKHQALTGVKTFVAHVSGIQRPDSLLPPPHFGEHTAEIIGSIGSM